MALKLVTGAERPNYKLSKQSYQHSQSLKMKYGTEQSKKLFLNLIMFIMFLRGHEQAYFLFLGAEYDLFLNFLAM